MTNLDDKIELANDNGDSVLSQGDLLGIDGDLIESGYATSLVKNYDRDKIKAKKSRIKEWDYYYVGDDKVGLALTIADNSYMGLASASVMNFDSFEYKTKSQIKFFTNGKIGLPKSSEIGDTAWRDSKVDIRFFNDGNSRRLVGFYDKFDGKNKLEFDVTLKSHHGDSIAVAVPFNKKNHFYYNQKINCMNANGSVQLGLKKHTFHDNALGVLDWGRGVWTFKNTWYWSSMSTIVDSHKIGFNFGYGFGQPKATENAIFYDDVITKIGKVDFFIPFGTNGKEDFLKPWTIKDEDGKVNLIFYPRIDRKDRTKFLWLESNQHQVFGSFCGSLILSDGQTLELNGAIGFAEKVFNKW